jgi:hypothetical protein
VPPVRALKALPKTSREVTNLDFVDNSSRDITQNLGLIPFFSKNPTQRRNDPNAIYALGLTTFGVRFDLSIYKSGRAPARRVVPPSAAVQQILFGFACARSIRSGASTSLPRQTLYHCGSTGTDDFCLSAPTGGIYLGPGTTIMIPGGCHFFAPSVSCRSTEQRRCGALFPAPSLTIPCANTRGRLS